MCNTIIKRHKDAHNKKGRNFVFGKMKILSDIFTFVMLLEYIVELTFNKPFNETPYLKMA